MLQSDFMKLGSDVKMLYLIDPILYLQLQEN